MAFQACSRPSANGPLVKRMMQIIQPAITAPGPPLHPLSLAPRSCRLKPQCLDARKGLAGLRRSPRLPKIVGGLLS